MPVAPSTSAIRLISTIRLPPKDPKQPFEPQLFDAKFYPYDLDRAEPVFAVTGGVDTLICRASATQKEEISILLRLKDSDPEAGLNSITWSKDDSTGEPLICIAGSNRKIQIFNATTGELQKTLIGHGGAINDLTTSPTCPYLLASGSEDQSIRIWDIRPRYQKFPTAVICAGEGHTASILSIAFHHNGRYLLSGGMDTRVNMWTIPSLPDENANTDNTTVLHYPHFSSFEVHSDYVDCVRFYGDLILSKAVNKETKDGRILLWKVNGFSSEDPIPDQDQAPTLFRDGAETRSAFTPRRGQYEYQVLLSFEIPRTEVYYMRFGLFHQPFKHPILVMANNQTRVLFWDLQALEIEDPGTENTANIHDGLHQSSREHAPSNKGNDSGSPSKAKRPRLAFEREESHVSSVSTQQSSVTSSFESKSLIADPFRPIKPHKTVTIPEIVFIARSAEWNIAGDWCVVTGDYGMVCLLHRRGFE